jgi:threonine synthase
MSDMIRYYSTNRNLEPTDEMLPFGRTVSFMEALMMGQAPDEGLFMPDRIPAISREAIAALRGKSYMEAARLVMEAFLAEDISRVKLDACIRSAYTFSVPLEKIDAVKYILRLDQGPTASFKDFAARMMARLMGLLKAHKKSLNVLVATSGDTGSAVGDAYRGVEGINVYILYPREEVSGRQKKQLDTIGENVQAISVAGKFDDCQNLVKQAFADPSLRGLNLTSANSINFGRILPQIIYYVYAYAQLAEPGEEIVFSIPSGNFGNALGCEYARRMGLPVKKLVMPVNENDEFPRFLETGRYEKISPSRACLSNAMNVGHPSNLARFFDLYGGTVDRNGRVHVYPDRPAMRKNIFSVSVSDQETLKTIKKVHDRYGVVLEPHGAVGWRGLEAYLDATGDSALCVSLETAHPAKFPEAVEEAIGVEPELPQSMKDLEKKTGEPVLIDNDYEAFRTFLSGLMRTEVSQRN